MPLKEVKEPSDKKPPKDKPAAAASEKSDEPWRYLEDGSKVRQGRKLPFENQLRALLDELSGALKLVDSFSGQVVSNQSEELAYGYAKLAKEDPHVRAFFERLTTGSAYTAVAVPTVLTVVPIMWHFGFMPAKLGVPVTLAAGVMPFTRGQEREYVASQQQEQAHADAAAAEQARATHPHGEAPTGDDADA